MVSIAQFPSLALYPYVTCLSFLFVSVPKAFDLLLKVHLGIPQAVLWMVLVQILLKLDSFLEISLFCCVSLLPF